MAIDFKAAIRAGIEREGWTLEELAKQSGVAYSRVHGYLARDGQIMDGNLAKLLVATGVSLKYSKAKPKKA
jgi:lambda repressor-like predicted transcriptional regulator